MFDDAPQNRPQPRKRPQQARSRHTVEAIAQVLEAEGYDALTTTRVAERAGVSIGTLYQYFPDKAAVVAGLVEAWLGSDVQALREAFAAAARRPLTEAADLLVDAFVGLFSADPGRSAAVLYGALRVRWRSAVDTLIDEMVHAVALLLTGRLADGRDAEQVAYVAVAATVGVVARSLVERPETLRDGRAAHEIRILLRSYLTAA
ncbi:MAG: TetR/AcrR family transcriptional regulator [Bacteroidota bacterium]